MPGAPHILDITSPQVQPTGAPGNDYERITASPEDFGAIKGKAFEKLGQGIEQASNEASDVWIQQQRMDNQVHASELHSWFSDQGTDLVSKFYTLEGRAGISQLPDYKQQLQKFQDQAVQQAGNNPELKALVATNTRNTMDRYTGWMTTHADQQRQKWYTETAKDNITSATGDGGMAILSNDIPALDGQLRRIDFETRNALDPQGYGKDQMDVEASKSKGQAVKNWVETAATNDKDPDNISHAMSIFERYTQQIDPNSRLEISKYLNAKAQARTIDRISDYYVGGANSSPLMPQIVESATKYDVNPAILSRQLYQESGLNPRVGTSRAGAQGVAQFIPETARRYGVNVHDPVSSIDGAARYMSDLKAQFGGNDGLALAAYNWGENHVAAWLASGANPAAMPAETRNYVRSITGQPIESWLSGKARTNFNQIDVDEVLGRVQRDPAFKDRPELQQAVMRNIIQKASILNRADALKNKQVKDQSDDAEFGLFKQIHTDDPNLTLGQILNNPHLTREAMERLTKQYEERGGTTKTDHTYGAGFYDLYQRVHLPEGDPQRLSDPGQLYSHVGPNGDLTVGGVDKLRSEIEQRKTPEGAAEGKMKDQFFKNARLQITGKSEHLGMEDHHGEEHYLGFMTHALDEYDKQRKAGKSPSELLDPQSKDYLGKSIGSYKRDPSQWYSDMVHDNPEIAGDMKAPAAGAAPPFDPNKVTSVEQLVDAYHRGLVNKQTADQLAVAKGWGFRKPPQPQVPISQ